MSGERNQLFLTLLLGWNELLYENWCECVICIHIIHAARSSCVLENKLLPDKCLTLGLNSTKGIVLCKREVFVCVRPISFHLQQTKMICMQPNMTLSLCTCQSWTQFPIMFSIEGGVVLSKCQSFNILLVSNRFHQCYRWTSMLPMLLWIQKWFCPCFSTDACPSSIAVFAHSAPFLWHFYVFLQTVRNSSSSLRSAILLHQW